MKFAFFNLSPQIFCKNSGKENFIAVIDGILNPSPVAAPLHKNLIKCICFLILAIITVHGYSQVHPVYKFLQEDTVVKKKFYEKALQYNTAAISFLAKENKDEYTKFTTVVFTLDIGVNPENWLYN